MESHFQHCIQLSLKHPYFTVFSQSKDNNLEALTSKKRRTYWGQIKVHKHQALIRHPYSLKCAVMCVHSCVCVTLSMYTPSPNMWRFQELWVDIYLRKMNEWTNSNVFLLLTLESGKFRVGALRWRLRLRSAWGWTSSYLTIRSGQV